MSDYYKIETEFKLGEVYVFEWKGRTKEKVFVGINECGTAEFDHVHEPRRSFVTPDRVLKGLKIYIKNEQESK